MSADRDQAFWLASKYLEECIEEEELRQLEELLRRSPDARVGFLNAVHLHRQLQLVVEPTADAAAPAKKLSTRRALSRPTPAPRRKWFLPLTLVAGAFAAVTLFIVAFPKPGGEEEAARLRTEAATREKAEREEARRRKVEQERARAQADRKRAEEDLAAVEVQRQKLAELEKKAQAERQGESERTAREQLALLEAERKALQEKLDKAKEAQRKAEEDDVARAAPPPAPVPAPVPAPPVPPPTVSVEATLAAVEGDVTVVGKETREAAKAGQPIFAAHGLVTKGPKSRAVMTFPDGTQVELGGDTTLTEVRGSGGKRVVVEKGRVAAQVAKQPADQAMIFATPNAEAKVLGTTLRILVGADAKPSTRLEVEEGKVQLKRLSDGKTVDVVTGHFAVAAVGIDLATKVLPPMEIPGLVLHWKLDDAGRVAIDSSGKNNHGRIVGARVVPGVTGAALNFVAESNFIGLPNFDFGDAFTIALWAKSPGDKNVDGGMTLAASEGFRFSAGGQWRTINFETHTKPGGATASKGDVFPYGEWNHVAITMDRKATKGKLYCNGVEVTGSNQHQADFKVTGPVEFGRAIGGTNTFMGTLDDIRIYNRVLTPQELVSLARRR